MDFNQHLEKIVEGIIADIVSNVAVQIDSTISGLVNTRLNAYDYSSHIKDAAAAAFDKRVAEYQIDPRKLESRIVEKINTTIEQVQANTAGVIAAAVDKQIASTNFQRAMTDAVGTIIADRLQEYIFPVNSINGNAISYSDFKLSGDCVNGGIIQNFGSTGIDDRATAIALTILDDATVVENNLLTKDLTVQGQMTVNGELVVNGSVPPGSEFYKQLVSSVAASTLGNLDTVLFDGYSSIIFDKIRNQGLDLSKITINNNEIINDNKLGSSITESNLQKVGQLRELQVSGETLLSETLYVSQRRVGINTIEPSGALSIWDDEIEIIAQKRQKDTGSFGTPRQQAMVLFANNKDNIVLNIDGSASIKDLRVGSTRFTSGNQPPNYVSERGHIVWNSNPNPGGPIGWICLGATNWANFGIID